MSHHCIFIYVRHCCIFIYGLDSTGTEHYQSIGPGIKRSEGQSRPHASDHITRTVVGDAVAVKKWTVLIHHELSDVPLRLQEIDVYR